VLVNDVDPEGAALTAVLVGGPAHGVVTLAANGTFIYTPDPNYNGPDSFTYSASDGVLLSVPATVTIVVTPTNDVPVATGEAYATDEDTPLIVAAPGLLANDVDIDGDRLTVVLVDRPLRGTVVANANGSFSYLPALNFSGTDSFAYRVNDGNGRDSNTVIVTITVNPLNDAPTAAADTYAVSQDRALSVAAPGVLINDRDVDANPLSAVLVTAPVNGQLVLNADGSFTYTPNVGYVGSDSFTYQSSDGLLLSAPVAVTFTVTAPPAKFYVADGTNGTTYKYSTTGSTLGSNVLSGRGALGIASNAAGTTQWVVDSGGNVFVYTNTGTLLGQWTPRGAGRPEGVTVWGNDLWVVDPSGDRVYKFTGGALLRTGRVAPTSSFVLNAANRDPKDLVTDGTSVWVVNDTIATDRVFKYSVAGVLQGSWTLSTTNPSPTGITIDPTNVSHIWTVDASTDRVYQYDTATTRLTGAQEPSTFFQLVTGNGNPQGIADPMVPGAPVSQAIAPSTPVEPMRPATEVTTEAGMFAAAASISTTAARPSATPPLRGESRTDDATPPTGRPSVSPPSAGSVAIASITLDANALQPVNRVRHELVAQRPSVKDRQRSSNDADDADRISPA
jgi:VCBS repeat-containing protein